MEIKGVGVAKAIYLAFSTKACFSGHLEGRQEELDFQSCNQPLHHPITLLLGKISSSGE